MVVKKRKSPPIRINLTNCKYALMPCPESGSRPLPASSLACCQPVPPARIRVLVRYEVLRIVQRKLGWKEVGDDDDWEICWTDTSVCMERILKLNRTQVTQCTLADARRATLTPAPAGQ